MKITIATRQSKLALVQAESIRTALLTLTPDVEITLLKMTTQGDRFLNTPLSQVGGKALFIKELEQALLQGQADIAVHSLKDVPAEIPNGLEIAAICQREDARDVFISPQYADLTALPLNAKVGTSSLRRQCQLRAIRPDLNIIDLRGNVDSRLEKVARHEFDAIVLAAAGLKRLQQMQAIRSYLAPEICLPAVGQGALGIECRQNDAAIKALLCQLDHAPSRYCITAERAMNQYLDGGCQVPIAAYATLDNEQTLTLQGLVGEVNGTCLLRSQASGKPADAEQIGISVAKDLLAQGAAKILQAYRTLHD